LEERLLDTLAMKQDLAMAALDIESDVTEVQLQSGMEELRRRLERLIGPVPDAPLDHSRRDAVEAEAKALQERRERIGAAGGQLVSSALQLVGELLQQQGQPAPEPQVVSQLHSNLAECIERTDDGRPQLRLTLPDDAALQQFAETLGRLLVPGLWK
jgi:hypothetical protein